MMNRFVSIAKNVLFIVKYYRFGFNFEHLNFSPIVSSLSLPSPATSSTSINDLMNDGFLWGVPKKRRNIERRLKRRFGVENYPDNAPILRPRNDIIICEQCGDHHEYYAICPTCYRKVKDETEKIRNEIKSQTDPLLPKEKEICFQYQNEQTSEENLNRFKVITIDRPRPQWFTKNLLTRSTPFFDYKPKDIIMDIKDMIKENDNPDKK